MAIFWQHKISKLNDVIEVKTGVYLHKLKQVQLRTTKSTLGSSNKQKVGKSHKFALRFFDF